ncbi:MAG: penicillin-binding transpeptidase domain-containing protein [Patescibacteria group bacterium]
MPKDFLLEESILDDLAKDLDLLEMPLSEKAFKFVGSAVFFVILGVIIRLFFIGVWSNNFYHNKALVNAGQIVKISTERGMIYDRFGESLVNNLSVIRVRLKIPELLKLNEQERHLTIKNISEAIETSEEEIRDLISVVDSETKSSVVLKDKITEVQAEKLKAFDLNLIQVEKNYKREYIDTEIFSHLIGYIGFVTKADLAENSLLSLNDAIGKSGLESYYDDKLRGVEGEIVYYRNAKGEIIDNKSLQDFKSGYNIKTTIDADFQRYFYNRLRNGLAAVGSESGVGIAINPKTGKILSLISLPSFDNNNITTNVLNDRRKPLFNRIISGLYSPGSTIKPLVALAALNEEIVNEQTKIFSRGYIEVPNPYFPDKPSTFVDWKPHGWVDLYSALARSSNIYFYALGAGLPVNESELIQGQLKNSGLGIEKLKEYWLKFGLNEKTGIDLPAEVSGFLPDPSIKEKNRQQWRLGDTYNISIGQGDLLITPMELVNYIAAFANGGKIQKPFVAEKIFSNNDNIFYETEPEIIADYSKLSSYIKEIQKGMIDAVAKPYGTAYLLNDLPVKVAAKTGTAQIEGNKKINAFFVGYLPDEYLVETGVSLDKQIVVLIMIENAKEGSLNALPVAKDVFNWYYKNRISQ